jgi:hypothetical protein
MGLQFLPQSGQWNAEHESVRFEAEDVEPHKGDKSVTCLIHKVALADLCHLHDASLDDLLAGFEKQRRRIEAIAAWKYQSGAQRKNGAIFIAAQDLEAFARRGQVEREVTLVFDSAKVHYDTLHEWVRFYAVDGDAPVSCAVTRGALLDRERIAQASEKQLVEAYLRNRQIIDGLAETKYRNNEIEPGGIVVVMSRDLNH